MQENQMKDKEVCLSVDELRPDMVLARSVVTLNGEMLLPKNTILTVSNYKKLINDRVRAVYVKEKSVDYNKQRFTIKTELEKAKKLDIPLERKLTANREIRGINIPVEEQVCFKEFKTEYTEMKEQLKSTLLAIGDGAQINLPQLYTLTDGTMSKLKSKGDVFSYLNYLRNKDEATFSHSTNVALLSNLFGLWLGYSNEQLMILTTAGSLHDIGKTKIPPKILNKEGKLTDEEFAEIKKHTTLGYRVLEGHNIPEVIKQVALTHHEKIDGSGYPIGLVDDQIHPYSKIVAICDIYDAMTANRSYRKKLCPFDVIKQFEQSSFGRIDTKYLLIFLQNIAYTYLGSSVRLSDGRVGDVVFINRNQLTRPIVKLESDEIVDLTMIRDIYVEEIIV